MTCTPSWQPYDLEDRYTMVFDDRSAMVADPHAPNAWRWLRTPASSYAADAPCIERSES
jgi:carboxylesterase type B